MQTIQQKYAQSVYQQITQFASPYNKQECKEYGSMAHKLPVLVRQAGLIQALAYVHTRGKDSQKVLLEHLAQTLGYSRDDFLQKARTAELPEYILLTRQTLWALEWYKRFAQSILGVEPGEGE
jgi:CRISPR-associated protein Cmr5